MELRTIVVFTAFVASAVAGPLNTGTCARHCTGSSSLKYLPGTTTEYRYDTLIHTSTLGGSSEESRVHVTADVLVSFLDKCNGRLRVRQSRITSTDPKHPNSETHAEQNAAFRQALESQALDFSYQDGVVDAVCAKENAEPWVVNVLKGVLSMLQVSVSRVEDKQNITETDINGVCNTEYQFGGRSRNGRNIHKVKDFRLCTNRHDAETAMQSTPFGLTDMPNTVQLLTGKQLCKVVINNDIIMASDCKEQHDFQPFSDHEKGARTTVIKKLEFKSARKENLAGGDYRPTRNDLTFDHGKREENDNQKREEAVQQMRDLCTTAKDDITIDTPAKFTHLIHTFRKLSAASLASLYKQVESICPDPEVGKRFFIDALQMTGTDGAIEVTMKMADEMDEVDISSFLAALAFVPKPTERMIDAVAPLLKKPVPQANMIIPIMVHRYCSQHPDCETSETVRGVIRQLLSKLGNGCHGRDSETVILALKGLGNIGLDVQVSPVLKACLENPQNDIETRVAAIEAYHKMPCDETSRASFLDIFANKDENVELRIASYQGMMMCPTVEHLNAIMHVLHNDPIRQVRSYVCSHMKNINEVPSHIKQEIRRMLNSVHIMNKCSMDPRKYSRNYDFSFGLPLTDTGVNVNGDLIFTPQSFVPKKGNVNITINLFGQRLNLLEFGSRVEGLDFLLERYFGPTSGIPSNKLPRLENRQRRSVDDNKITEKENEHNAQAAREFQAAMYAKIFGNDIIYKRFQDSDFDVREKMEQLMNMVTSQIGDGIKFSKSVMFMDSVLTVPTSSGFPIRLQCNGTANVMLKMAGKMNVRSLNDINIRGNFEPSGAIMISGLMAVDAAVLRSGIKLVTTLHSSTALGGHIEVRDGKILSAALKVPRETMEIVTIQNKLYIVHADKAREHHKYEGTKVAKCIGESTSRIVGMELCFDVITPSEAPDSILTSVSSPSELRLYLKKSDKGLTSYNFEAMWASDKVKSGHYIRHGVMSFNTPGSVVNREVSLKFDQNQAERYITIKAQSPMKNVFANAKYRWDDERRGVDFSLTADDVEQVSLQTEIRIEKLNGGTRYVPSLEWRARGYRGVSLNGFSYVRPGNKYTTEMTLLGITEEPVEVKGDIDIKGKKYEVDLELKSFFLSAKAEGFSHVNNGITSKLTLDYRLMEGQNERLEANLKFRDLSASSLTKYTGVVSLQSSDLPEWSSVTKWSYQKTEGHFENTLEVTVGDGRRSRVHEISALQLYHREDTDDGISVTGTLKFAYPQQNMDYSWNLRHRQDSKSLNNRINLVYGPDCELVSVIGLSKESNKPFQIKGDFQLQYPGHEIGTEVTAKEVVPGEYQATATARWQQGQQARVEVNYRDKSDETKLLDHSLGVEINVPQSKHIATKCFVTNGQGLFTFGGDVEYNRQKYSGKGTYTYSPQNHHLEAAASYPGNAISSETSLKYNQDQLVGTLDVRANNARHVTGKIEMKKSPNAVSGSGDFMWDADRDRSKKFSFDGELTQSSQEVQSSLSVSYPSRSIRSTVSAKSVGEWKSGATVNAHADLEWEKDKKIKMDLNAKGKLGGKDRNVGGNLKLVTPFDGHENYELVLKHIDKDHGQEWENSAGVHWARAKHFTVGTNGKHVSNQNREILQTHAQLSSHAKGFEAITLDANYERGPKDISHKLDLQWEPQKKLSFGMLGYVTPNGFNMGMNYTGPFQNLQQATVNIGHQHSDKMKMEAVAQWNYHNRATLDVESQHQHVGDRHNCYLNVAVTSPFRGYERSGIKASYVNNGNNLDTSVEGYLGDKRVTTGVAGSMSGHLGAAIQGKFYFTSPIKDYESVVVSVNHNHEQGEFKTNIDAHLPKHQAFLKSSGKLASVHDFQAAATLTSSLWEQISATVTHKLGSGNVKSGGEVTVGRSKTSVDIAGSHAASRQSRNMDFTVHIITPIQDYRDLRAVLHYERQNKQFRSRVQASKNGDTIQLIHNMNLDNFPTFDHNLQLITPFSRFKTVQMVTKQVVGSGQFSHNTDLTWDKNQRISLQANYKDTGSRRSNNVVFQAGFNGPFSTLSSLKIHASHEDDGREYKPQATIEWNNFKKVVIEGHLLNNKYEVLDATLKITTPVKGFETLTLTGKYDIVSKPKSAEVALQWDPRGRKMVSIAGTVQADQKNAEAQVNFYSHHTDRITLTGNYQLSKNEKTGNIVYRWASDEVALAGRMSHRKAGSMVTISLESPYSEARHLSAMAKYDNTDNQLSGQTTLQWDQKKIEMTAEVQKSTTNPTARLTFRSPISGFSSVMIDAASILTDSEKGITFTAQWSPKKKVEVEASYKTDSQGTHSAHATFGSPFAGYEEIAFRGRLQSGSERKQGDMALQWQQDKAVMLRADLKQQGLIPSDVSITFSSPFSGMEQIKFTSAIGELKEKLDITGRLQVNNKVTDLKLFLDHSDLPNVEGTLEIRTPLESFTKLGIIGHLKRNEFGDVDAYFAVNSPIAGLETLELMGKLHKITNGHEIKMAADVSGKKLSAQAIYTNRQFREMQAEITVTTPFDSLQSVHFAGSILNEEKHCSIAVTVTTPGAKHVMQAGYHIENGFQADFMIECPYLSQEKISITASGNVHDPKNMNGEVVLQMPRETHRATAHFAQTQRNILAEVQLESPFLKSESLKLHAELIKKSNKASELTVSAGSTNEMHTMVASYEEGRKEFAATIKADSSILSAGPAVLTLKLKNDKSKEITATLTTSQTVHNFDASLQTGDSDITVKINIDCPALPPTFRTIVATLTASNNNFKNMNSELAISLPNHALKVLGAVKRNSNKDLEATLKLVTPFDHLQTASMKATYNLLPSAFDGSFVLETSNPQFSQLSISGSADHSTTKSNARLKMVLPVEEYKTVDVVATADHDPNFTTIQPQLVLTLPRGQYSAYGSYKRVPNEFDVKAGYEWARGKRVELESSLKMPSDSLKFEVTAMTPFQNHRSYKAMIDYRKQSSQHNIHMTYTDPHDKKADIQGTFTYDDPLNFNIHTFISCPFSGVKDVTTRIHQEYKDKSFVTAIEHKWDEKKQIDLIFKHEYNARYQGRVEMNSPVSFEATYVIPMAQNPTGSLEVMFKGREMVQIQGSIDKHNPALNVNLPTIPFTATSSAKIQSDGGDITIKTSCPHRSITFHSMLDMKPSQFRHGMELTWSQRQQENLFYEVGWSSSALRREGQTREAYAKVGVPARAIEIRGTQLENRDGHTLKCDLYWDASRDTSKQVSVTFNHKDKSSRNIDAHEYSVQATHPSLSKPITANMEYTVSPNEASVKTEFDYARHPQHTVVLEARARNMARNRRETYYAAEVVAKHPASSSDIRVEGEAKSDRHANFAHLQWNYVNQHRENKNGELEVKFIKPKSELEVKIQYGNEVHRMKGQVSSNDTNFAVKVDHADSTCHKCNFLELDFEDWKVGVNLSVPSMGNIYMNASMPSDAAFFEVTRNKNGREVKDLLFDIELSPNRILQSRLHWRPDAYKDLKHDIQETLETTLRLVDQHYSTAIKEVEREMSDKRDKISRIISNELQPLVDDISREMSRLQQDWERFGHSLKTMYNNNELYIKDAITFMSDAADMAAESVRKANIRIESLLKKMAKGVAHMSHRMFKMTVWSLQEAAKIAKEISHFIMRTAEVLQSGVTDLQEKLIRTVSDALASALDMASKVIFDVLDKVADCLIRRFPFLDDAYNTISDATSRASRSVQDSVTSLTRQFRESPIVDAVRHYGSQIVATTKDFTVSNTIDKVTDTWAAVAESLQEKFQSISSSIEDIRKHPSADYMKEVVHCIVMQVIDAYRTEESNAVLNDLNVNVYNGLQRELHHLWHRVVDRYADIQNFVYDPENGKIEIAIQMPGSTETIRDIFDITKYPEYQQLKELVEKYKNGSSTFYIWDPYYKLKYISNPKRWLPPFTAKAMVAGNQHYFTFDNRPYEFAGDCSYLLAHDFVDKNFSMVVNYMRDRHEVVQKSITVISDGKEITINPDYKITIDDAKVEAPQQIGLTTVKREGDILTIDSARGAKLECNFRYRVCRVEMSGYYHGKVAGLLGTYNYEPSDDFYTPDRKITGLENFVASWEVGTNPCRKSQNLAHLTSNLKATKKCEMLFSNTSSRFWPCFGQVHPHPFLEMCKHDLATVGESLHEERICTSAAAYRAQCKDKGVHLRMPESCVQCEKHDGSTMSEGDVIKITDDTPVRKADVVFIVEEKPCNEDNMKVLDRLAHSIEDNLAEKGFRNTHYAVVGFGGDEVHAKPHVHTADGQIFSSVRSIESAFTSLTVGNTYINVFEAIHYASNLPSRPGARKIFILIKCSACSPESIKSDYSGVLRALIDSNTVLHVIMPHEFEMKIVTKAAKTKQIIGLDKDYAYTFKDIKDTEMGDRDLLAQMKIPKDVCVPLALDLNGTMFNLHRIYDGKRNQHKKFFDIMARRIVKTIEPTDCEICECIATEDGVGKSMCQRCFSPVVARMLSGDLSPVIITDNSTPPMTDDEADSENDDSQENQSESSAKRKKPSRPKVRRLRKKGKKSA